jgi:hypothetical protein
LKIKLKLKKLTGASMLTQFIKAASERRLLFGINRRLKPLIVSVAKSALRRPWVKLIALSILNLVPELKTKIYRIMWKDITLSPRAMRIYTALSTCVPTHSKGNE